MIFESGGSLSECANAFSQSRNLVSFSRGRPLTAEGGRAAPRGASLLAMSTRGDSFLDEVREARAAREARSAASDEPSDGSSETTSGRPRRSIFRTPSLAQRPPSSYRLTSALGRAVAAAANTSVGLVRESVASAINATSRRGRRGDLMSDDVMLRRIVERIERTQREFEDDAEVNARRDARLARAVRGLSPAEIDTLPDLSWEPKESTSESGEKVEEANDGDGDVTLDGDVPSSQTHSDECAVCFVGFEAGDKLKHLPCGHSGFHLVCIKTWLERSPTCPLCRCACRSAWDIPGDDDNDLDDRDDPDLRSETFNRHLQELTAMHEEESAWLDRLEAQPRRVSTRFSTRDTADVSTGNEVESTVSTSFQTRSQVPLLDLDLTMEQRRAQFVPFDPNATSYMRRNYSELLELREEERALVEQLDQLAVTEEALHGRIADATRGRDDALRAREAEEREIEGWGGTGAGVATTVGPGWRSASARDLPEHTAATSQQRGASATSLALAAAERDHHSRVNAVDALSRWRSSG